MPLVCVILYVYMCGLIVFEVPPFRVWHIQSSIKLLDFFGKCLFFKHRPILDGNDTMARHSIKWNLKANGGGLKEVTYSALFLSITHCCVIGI